LTSWLRLAAGLVTLAAVAASCAVGPTSLKAKPADLWSVMPSQADVRSLMGDSNWYSGPPSFEVEPLDAGTTPVSEKFGISQAYEHLGSDEKLIARYVVFDKTSSATSTMTDFQTIYGTSISTTPKIGDQVLYYATFAGGGAPYLTRTFVRVGQVVLTLLWTKKDSQITVKQMGKNAKLFADPLRNLSKTHAQLAKVDPALLPPPGLDITPLGSANLPLESFVVMINAGLPGTLLNELQSMGVTSLAYGDYALNLDTHMEVQTAALRFPSPQAAASFAGVLSPSPPDANGIGSGYIKVSGGTPASGEYDYVFAAGPYAVLLICKASIDGEAATRECEDPMERTAIAWRAALGRAA